MKWMPRIIGALVFVGLFFGWKLYNKSNTAGDVKKQLLALCESDGGCLSDVKSHFDACFESSYNMGGRRRSASLDGQGLTTCINSKSGVNHFSYDPQ